MEKDIEYCDCKKPLWEWIDENRIKILGNKAQEYEIGFSYIELVCNKCGLKHYVESSAKKAIDEAHHHEVMGERFGGLDPTALNEAYSSRDSIGEKNFFELDSYHKKILLKKLSKKQQDIFKIISNGKVKIDFEKGLIYPDDDTKTALINLKIPQSKIANHIWKIIESKNDLEIQTVEEKTKKDEDKKYDDLAELHGFDK